MKIFNVPGLRNSDDLHWQTLWEKKYPQKFTRIQQDNWEQPDCNKWVSRISEVLEPCSDEEIILVGHSVGCAALVQWFERSHRKIKGALLVAPSDVDRTDYPKYITGFAPMPSNLLPFPSIVVASTNDHVVSLERARYFASCWGSQFKVVENGGHLESNSGLGEWAQGLAWLDSLTV